MQGWVRVISGRVQEKAFLSHVCLLGLLCIPLVSWDTQVFRNAFYAVVLLPALCIFWRQPREWKWTHSGLEWSLLLFWGYLAVSLSWSEEPATEWLGYLALIAMFFLGFGALPRSHIERFVFFSNPWPWVILMAVSVGIQYALFHHGYDPKRHFRFYLHGIGHPLLTANVLGLMGAMVMARMVLVSERYMNKCGLLAALAIIVFVVLMTKVRSALLGLMVVAGVLWLLRMNRRTMFYFIAAGMGLAVMTWLYAPILGRGLSSRPDIWASTLGQALESPWFGHGLGMNPQYAFPQHNIVFHDPHNGLIAVLYYGGVLALVAWLSAICFAVRNCLVRRKDSVLACAVLAVLAYAWVVGFFEGGYFINKPRPNWYYLWLPLALALVVGRGERQVGS